MGYASLPKRKVRQKADQQKQGKLPNRVRNSAHQIVMLKGIEDYSAGIMHWPLVSVHSRKAASSVQCQTQKRVLNSARFSFRFARLGTARKLSYQIFFYRRGAESRKVYAEPLATVSAPPLRSLRLCGEMEVLIALHSLAETLSLHHSFSQRKLWVCEKFIWQSVCSPLRH